MCPICGSRIRTLASAEDGAADDEPTLVDLSDPGAADSSTPVGDGDDPELFDPSVRFLSQHEDEPTE